MSERLVISRETMLPKLEINGIEFPYDVSDTKILERLQAVAERIKPEGKDVIDACKEFITVMFCFSEDPVNHLAKVCGTSMVMWTKTVLMLMKYIKAPEVKDLMEQTSFLKRAADE